MNDESTMADSKNLSEPVFDIAKPGTSAPSSSAKPIIVTNRPVLQDPMMVVQDNDKTEEPAAPPPTSPSAKKKIEPLRPLAEVKAEEKTEPETPTVSPEPSAAKVEADESPKPEEKPEPALPEGEEAGLEGGKKKTATDEAALKKAAQRAAELEKLADSRKYYLPINQVEKRRTKHYVMGGIVLILILGLAWVDIALDAGLVTIPGVTAPTHFFK